MVSALAESLSRNEKTQACAAVKAIMAGEATQAQIGAFLVALQVQTRNSNYCPPIGVGAVRGGSSDTTSSTSSKLSTHAISLCAKSHT